MSLLSLILLGALQGLLEWLPVSSTTMLAATASALGVGGPQLHSLMPGMHLGAVCALAAGYWREYAEALSPEAWEFQGLFLVSSMAGTAVTGVPAYIAARQFPGSPYLKVAVALAATAAAAAMTAAVLLSPSNTRGCAVPPVPLGVRGSFGLGLIQGLAVLPGLSRTGVTVAYLISMGLEPGEAFLWSFYVGGPPVLAFSLYELLAEGGLPGMGIAATAASFAAGFASIYLAVKLSEGAGRLWAALAVAGGLVFPLLFL